MNTPNLDPTPAADRYSLDDLERLSGVVRRTIRYYIQLGLVPRPVGETRAAYYTWQHLGDLLAVRRLTEQGLTLEAVRQRLRGADDGAPAEDEGGDGSVRMMTHVRLATGIALVVDLDRAGLGSVELRRLARELAQCVRRLQEEATDVDR